MSEKKIFEDYTSVSCNDCKNYWDDSCSGVPQGSEKRCTAFVATRNVNIPAKIEHLRKEIKWLSISVFLCEIAVLIHLLQVRFGW